MHPSRSRPRSTLLTLVALTAFVVLSLPQPSRSQEGEAAAAEAKREKVLALLEASGQLATAELQFDAMLAQFVVNPNLGPRFAKKFKQLAKPSDLVELTVPVLQENLTDEDLDAALVWWSTPAGKNMAALQPKLMKESMEASMRWGQEMAVKVMHALASEGDQGGEEGGEGDEPEDVPQGDF